MSDYAEPYYGNPNDEEPSDGEKRRFTTVHDRYHIGHKEHGLLITAMSKADAFKFARAEADELKEPVTVFDSMARKGAQDLWTVAPKAQP